jgi:hypothetical protein
MRCVCAFLTAMTIAITCPDGARAIATALIDKDIDRALKLAQAVEQKRAAFHAAYIVRVDDAVVEQVEVVTEFRRYVLSAEEQLRLGNWLFVHSVRDAREKLRPWRDRVSLVARLRFHPHNTLMAIPPYDITIGRTDLLPVNVIRTPIHALPSGRPGDFSAPLMGATIEAVFDARSVGQVGRPVSVSLAARAVASVPIDFARLE